MRDSEGDVANSKSTMERSTHSAPINIPTPCTASLPSVLLLSPWGLAGSVARPQNVRYAHHGIVYRHSPCSRDHPTCDAIFFPTWRTANMI